MSNYTDVKTRVLVAFGGNLDFEGRLPQETIAAALQFMEMPQLFLENQSRFFQTPCFPVSAGPDYVNAAAVFSADPRTSPADVLAHFHRIEQKYGRARDKRWGGRTLDIDLLAMGDAVLPDRTTYAIWRDLPAEQQAQRAPDQLILPHPRLQDRAFVLVPLMDVAPDWRHPVSSLTVRQMFAALPQADRDAVVPIPQP
jgi:2-amino-4-hydroxy-6-hydroxymethyldihydropteridine diphosphokinase